MPAHARAPWCHVPDARLSSPLADAEDSSQTTCPVRPRMIHVLRSTHNSTSWLSSGSLRLNHMILASRDMGCTGVPVARCSSRS